MKTVWFTFLMTFLAAIPSIAQVDKEAGEVQRTIGRLFEGMQRGDSAMVHSAFMPEVTSATISDDKANSPSLVRESTIQDFLVAVVGTPHKNVWNEETWNMTIKVDGNFAQAWCDYAFFIGHTFSHCGVDAFHLFKSKGEWKIFHIADTRRKAPCTIPDKIKAKHKE
jgi:Putative lumazine-binding